MSTPISSLIQSSNTTLALDLATRIFSKGANVQSALEYTIPGFKLLHGYIHRRFGFDITRLVSFGVGGVALIALIRYTWVNFVYPYILDFCTSTVAIREKDNLSNAVAKYLAQRYMERSPRFISAVSNSSGHDNETRETNATYDALAGIEYSPSVGSHWFLYEYWPFMFEHRPIDSDAPVTLDQTLNDSSSDDDEATIVIRCLGWNATRLRSFLASVQNWSEQENEKQAVTEVRVPHLNKDWLGYWHSAKYVMSRPLHTVELEADIKDSFVSDVKRFLDPATKQFYKDQGIPYRRGYLLHGPPGTGKSSLVKAIAGHFQLTLCVISLSAQGMTGTVLYTLFNRLPKRCVVALEDIDSAGIKTRAELKQMAADAKVVKGKAALDAELEGITLSDLLNVLDGTTAAQGRILILTSNTPEILDSALIRAGRIDRQVHMPEMTEACACSIFKRMYSEDSSVEKLPDLADQFARKLPEGQITAAEVQGFLLDHKADPCGAVADVEKWSAALVLAKNKGKNIIDDSDTKSANDEDSHTKSPSGEDNNVKTPQGEDSSTEPLKGDEINTKSSKDEESSKYLPNDENSDTKLPIEENGSAKLSNGANSNANSLTVEDEKTENA